MAKINLLPWREELRKQRKTEFFTSMGIGVVVTALLFFLVYFYIGQLINYQNSRNTHLEGQIALLDNKIKEIDRLERQKENLIQRMEAVQRLQTNRPIVVHLFDELVTTLPDGVFLTEIAQQGAVITLKGVSRSQARVSNYMRNIEASEWLTNPRLTVIETGEQEGRRINNFTLVIQQKSQKSEEDEEGLGESA